MPHPTATTTNALDTDNLTSSLVLPWRQQQRYFSRVSHSPIYRRKTFKWSHTKLLVLLGGLSSRRRVLDLATDPNPEGGPLPRHVRRFVGQHIRRHGASIRRTTSGATAYVHPIPHGWMDRVDELREGRDMAADAADLLPRHVDGRRRREMQQKDREQREAEDAGVGLDGEDKDLHDLYELFRLGILYEDEHERGPGFTLDTIPHDTADEPLYRVTLRDRRRPRRRSAPSGGKQPQRSEEHAADDVTSDAALAALLAEADFVDVCARDLDGSAEAGPSRKEGDTVEALRAQQRLWEAFRRNPASDLDQVAWEVV
ncbi:glucosamine--fructose-6-phosphate aminotransferase [Purpureocillium lavendulum]|uniref:Glucosamine--fructose-6-phosphate aminotransferase n=1 Tax=Purpureocillium lavendulum TaxID=1247861 RepID=A0AB34G2T5_9HYPO|nr:glucosamine--fructose-6-phosphate aminotransferase [Purpureocillium lavendulum]